MSLSSTPFSHQGYSSDVSSPEYYCFDSNETECLEHYENNLEKYKGAEDIANTHVIANLLSRKKFRNESFLITLSSPSVERFQNFPGPVYGLA
ncbi:unnamed protein product [Onchocerca flexuosa]|uniref:Ovule protein n=1 Tax=Onchocerca flexuosa TaxID=387005 RepID=A0A183H4S3_9BILA|nr:unnamed protein product [Onchocerca flexuosa]